MFLRGRDSDAASWVFYRYCPLSHLDQYIVFLAVIAIPFAFMVDVQSNPEMLSCCIMPLKSYMLWMEISRAVGGMALSDRFVRQITFRT